MTLATLPNFGQRITARRRVPGDREISVDSFAGVGGWGVGEEAATGWAIDVAINHDAYAIANHAINHPATRHYQSDVFEIDPRQVERGRKIGHCHFSPDCTHHSRARGSAPVSDRVRGLAWVVLAWAFHRRPRVITMENVREFMDWGPAAPGSDGLRRADPTRKGQTFAAFVGMLGGGVSDDDPALDEAAGVLAHLDVPREALVRGLGYEIEYRSLRACDYGAPTIRERFYLIGRSDGEAIRWPDVTHGPLDNSTQKERETGVVSRCQEVNDGKETCEHTGGVETLRSRGGDKVGKRSAGPEFGQGFDSPRDKSRANHVSVHGSIGKRLAPYRTAAECIDWSIPCPSIFLTPEQVRELYEATGIRVRRPLKPATLRRIANGVMRYVVEAAEPFVVRCAHGDGKGGTKRWGQSVHGLDQPLPTLTQTKDFALVAAFLNKHRTGATGDDLRNPMPTITAGDRSSHTLGVTAAHLVQLRGTCRDGGRLDAAMPTLTSGGNHVGLVAAFLQTYYSQGSGLTGTAIDEPMPTIVGKDRIGLVIVTIHGEQYVIADIGMRMLKPHELLRAQFGEFADGWVLTGTQAQQVAGIGNSVCPHVSRAIVAANYQPRRIAVEEDGMTPGSVRMTVWEVWVDPTWKRADADLAAMVCVLRPGAHVRLVDVVVGPGLWFERGARVGRREVTPRRLAAARRALRLERERVPLFADQVEAEQPTPEERIERIDAGMAVHWQEDRDQRAQAWRRCRRELAELPAEARARVVEYWNRRTYPGDPTMLIYLIREMSKRGIVIHLPQAEVAV